MKSIRKLDPDQFSQWRRDAQLIERDDYGEKVLRLADGSFLKLFRRKKLLSRALIVNPAQRFAANATVLKGLGIPCPVVLAVYRLADPRRTMVHYEPLVGQTLRQLLDQSPRLRQCELFIQLAEFITSLHDKGVYFRSLHMGNIVRTLDGALGLIDISDMRCHGRPLSQGLRRRNYRHLMRYREDWARVSPEARACFGTAAPQALSLAL